MFTVQCTLATIITSLRTGRARSPVCKQRSTLSSRRAIPICSIQAAAAAVSAAAAADALAENIHTKPAQCANRSAISSAPARCLHLKCAQIEPRTEFIIIRLCADIVILIFICINRCVRVCQCVSITPFNSAHAAQMHTHTHAQPTHAA